MNRSQYWLGFALAGVLTVPAHATHVQRVAAFPWDSFPSLQTSAPNALASPSRRRAARYVITGALLGGVIGYVYYRHSLDPDGEDWFAAINIPVVVGAGSVLGAAIGWEVQRATAPTSAAGQRARATSVSAAHTAESRP